MPTEPKAKKPAMGMGSIAPQMQGPIKTAPGGSRPQGGRFAPPSRGPMPLPPSAAPRPAPPMMGSPMRPGGGFGGPRIPPPFSGNSNQFNLPIDSGGLMMPPPGERFGPPMLPPQPPAARPALPPQMGTGLGPNAPRGIPPGEDRVRALGGAARMGSIGPPPEGQPPISRGGPDMAALQQMMQQRMRGPQF